MLKKNYKINLINCKDHLSSSVVKFGQKNNRKFRKGPIRLLRTFSSSGYDQNLFCTFRLR